MARSPMASITDTFTFQSLIPFLMLFLAFPIGVPQVLLDFILHPTFYLTYPIRKGIDHARGKFFFFCWRVMSPMTDGADAPNKESVLTKAYGTVLEIGAGVGDNIKYYDRRRVHRLIIVEPNTDMHPYLRQRALQSGYTDRDGSMLLLGCGGAASDEKALDLAGVKPGSVDTIASIHVLCGIPKPASAIEMYRRLLKPGGLLVFYEHVRSELPKMANIQGWYTRNIWKTLFDNCELDRPTGDWIIDGPNSAAAVHILNAENLGLNGVDEKGKRPRGANKRWKEYEIEVPEEQPRNSILPHVRGYAIKA